MNKAIILNGGIAPSLSLSTLMLGRHFKLSRKMSEISGTSPLSFISTGSALKNYRIYGNEINGQYVGDKTLNLFDEDYPNIAANWDVKYRPIYVGDGTVIHASSTRGQVVYGNLDMMGIMDIKRIIQ